MTEADFRHDFDVQLMHYAASDEDVVNAARVSVLGSDVTDREFVSDKDAGLINYLMRNRHGTPFEHNSFTFFISAPIFVFREFQRHRMFSFNEESGRYKELDPVFYMPDDARPLRQVGKPGSYTFEKGDEFDSWLVFDHIRDNSLAAYDSYQTVMQAGIAREVARMVLPLNIYSSMYATCNARTLMHFLSLRTASEHANYPSFPMYEIHEVALRMEDLFKKRMPITWEAFNKHGRVAP